MIGLVLSFLLGLVLFPAIYACLPSFLSEFSKRRRFKLNPKPDISVSETLRLQITESLHKSTDVAWVNVMIQRLYTEMVKNFSFESRIKSTIMKRFIPALQIGVIKSVKIIQIDFGKEAPYIRDIRTLGEDEMDSLMKCNNDSESVNLEALSKTLEDSFGAEEHDESEIEEAALFEKNEIRAEESDVPVGKPGIQTESPDILARKPGIQNEKNILQDNGLFRHRNTTTSTLKTKEKIEYINTTPFNKPENDVIGFRSKNTIPFKASENNAPFTAENCVEFNEKSSQKQTIEFVYGKMTPDPSALYLDDNTVQNIYKSLVMVANVEYFGGYRISLEIELPRKIFVYATIVLKGFKGEMLFRMPAENYDTRYEFAFARYPSFSFEVESGLNTGKSKFFFQKSISGFLKKAIVYSLKKTVVYPNWYQQYQGFLSSARNMEHKIKKITIENISGASEMAEILLNYTGFDYKIISFNNGIFFRKALVVMNIDQSIYLTHFKIPEHMDTEVYDESVVFDGLSVQESRLLNRFFDLSILDGVISGFKGIRVTHSKKACSIVTLLFVNTEYEFVRYIYKDFLIFQRNDVMRPDFFIFRINDKSLHIYSCCVTEDYKLGKRRTTKLKNKLFSQPMALLGSSMLYKLMHFRQGNRYMPQGKADKAQLPTELQHECGLSELEDIFHEALQIGNENLVSYSIRTTTSKANLLKYLRQDIIRTKLFSETGRIFNSFKESDKIKTVVIEDIRSSEIFPLNKVTRELVIHSYFDDQFIVDINIERNLMFIYRIEDMGDGASTLKLITRKDMNLKHPNCFIEALQLRISHARFLDKADEREFCTGDAHFDKEIKTFDGSVYFEFHTEVEDDFQFKVMSCKKEVAIFDIYKVISNRPFRLLLPTENDFLRFVLIPKHRRNKFIRYKMCNLDVDRDYYVDANIGLGSNTKFVLPIKGFPTHVIFWERDSDSGIKGYLEDHDVRHTIDNCGIIRAECRDYWLIYKNKDRKKRNVHVFLGMVLKI